MNIESLKTKRVGVLGYGREGQSVARYLLKHGITPVLFDKDSTIDPGNLTLYSGADYLTNLKSVEVVFRSPGFWRKHRSLKEFEANGGIITSQTIYFFENCPSKIIGVTGTKGKGTTTSLAHKIAVAANHNAYITGNIGLTEPLDFLDELKNSDLVYYELSSFQLQDLEISPYIGVILMTTADHLDQHESIVEYHEAKESIVKFQKDTDFAIINKDFSASTKIGMLSKGNKLWYGKTKVSFGIQIENLSLLSRNLVKFGVLDGQLLSLKEMTLRGEHNLQNVSAALLASVVLGIDIKTAIDTAKKFVGLEHRLEFVTEVGGVKYYNDSFSTTPETAVAGISSFNEPLFLILGGSEKNLDYKELGEKISTTSNIEKVFLIGETALRMKAQLINCGVLENKIMTETKTFEQIFEYLKTHNRPGSVVLLSPATASFDMFENYKDRGNKFKNFAKNL